MSQPTPAVRKLGQRLLEHELGSPPHNVPLDATVLAAAAERATQRLAKPLGRLIGGEGYWGLLRRAVHVARVESPLLQELPLAEPVGGVGGVGGLDAALRDADPTLARDALTAVLAHLLWLLVTFIGDDLTRTLREAWPELKLAGETLLSIKE